MQLHLVSSERAPVDALARIHSIGVVGSAGVGIPAVRLVELLPVLHGARDSGVESTPLLPLELRSNLLTDEIANEMGEEMEVSESRAVPWVRWKGGGGGGWRSVCLLL